jgi:hypothetical protein
VVLLAVLLAAGVKLGLAAVPVAEAWLTKKALPLLLAPQLTCPQMLVAAAVAATDLMWRMS